MSVVSVSWCEFANFTLAFPNEREVSFGAWRYNSFVLVQNVDTGNIWKVETCETYPDYVSLDGYWKASRAFGIIAPVLGVIVAGSMVCLPGLGKASGSLFLIVSLCQGLTFLLLKSDICDIDTNPIFRLVNSTVETSALVKDDSCEIGSSATMSIVATVLWFLAALPPLFTGGSSDEGDGGEAPVEPGEDKVLDEPEGEVGGE